MLKSIPSLLLLLPTLFLDGALWILSASPSLFLGLANLSESREWVGAAESKPTRNDSETLLGAPCAEDDDEEDVRAAVDEAVGVEVCEVCSKEGDAKCCVVADEKSIEGKLADDGLLENPLLADGVLNALPIDWILNEDDEVANDPFAPTPATPGAAGTAKLELDDGELKSIMHTASFNIAVPVDPIAGPLKFPRRLIAVAGALLPEGLLLPIDHLLPLKLGRSGIDRAQ